MSIKKYTAISCLLGCLQSSMVFAYGEDIANQINPITGEPFCATVIIPPGGPTQDCLHSTFHYELVRTLARASGFCPNTADRIAVVSETVDTGQFVGELDNSPEIWLRGTERPGIFGNTGAGQQPIGLYYHFGRRGDDYPGQGNCSYFADTKGPCQVTDSGEIQSEANEIGEWALASHGLPRFGAPQISTDGENYTAVESGSIEALGVFLHSLADTYSHEACTIVAQLQGHELQPEECNAGEWHGQMQTLANGKQVFVTDEYGSGAEGIPYTTNAAQAVWLTLKSYRTNSLENPAPALWSDEKADTFINQWVLLSQPSERQSKAVNAFIALNAEAGQCE